MTNLPFSGQFRVTLPYGVAGNYQAGYHTGIDLVGDTNTTVYNVCDGIVKTVSYSSSYGNYVKVTDSSTGKVFLFAHLSSVSVSVGNSVSRTSVIGIMGSTGNATGPHLHLELRTPADVYGSQENPATYMGIPNVVGTYNSANYQISTPPNMMYAAHCQNLGWQEEKRNGEMAGLYGQGLRIEAIIINADINIQYRVHMAEKGWGDWVPNGCMAGTTGESRAIEAIEIISSSNTMVGQGYVENIGYQSEVRGTHITIGTTGQALRLEGFRIKFE